MFHFYADRVDLIKSLPEGYTINFLKPEHAELVSSCWKFDGTKSADAHLRYMIEHLPNICTYNERGEPVSWNTIHLDGSA